MDADAGLDESTVAPDPFVEFARWPEAAVDTTDDRAAAMTLATATPGGAPSARVVLLRGFDDRGFLFFTNYDSRKASELAVNDRVALVWYWPDLDRQVRVEGRASRVSEAESDRYFESRPRGHQLGAWTSPQSSPIESRAALVERLTQTEHRFSDPSAIIARPGFWGGYRVEPAVFEFWVGRTDRLHDRVRYARSSDGWLIERLAP